MPRKKRKLPSSVSIEQAPPITEQVLVILPDGSLDIPWISPRATRLVMSVIKAVSDKPFPIKIVSGNIYCG
jgi:hypothetical protein